MATRVTITLDHAAINQLLTETTGATAERAALTTQRRVKSNITRARRVRTGAMRDSVRRRTTVKTRTVRTIQVYSDLHYTDYQERGIGPVYPVRAKALRFKPKGSNVFVFAARTRGFKGAWFFRDAANSVTPADFAR